MDYCCENPTKVTLPKQLEGVSSLRHILLTPLKTGQYRPDLPTLRMIEMDNKLGKLTDEHCLHSTLLTKAEFLKAADAKTRVKLNRFTEPVTYIDNIAEHAYDEWMTENKTDWEELLKSDRLIAPLDIPFGNERFVNYKVRPLNINEAKQKFKHFSKLQPQDESPKALMSLLPNFNSKPNKIQPISLLKVNKGCTTTQGRTCSNKMEQTKIPFQSKSNEIRIQAAMAKKNRMPFTKS